MSDLSQTLQDWPWRPGRLDVRRFQAADGRFLLQVRVELGVLQMEADGRPDGLAFRGAAGALEHFRGRDGRLEPDDVAALATEIGHRRQRALACATLEDWVRVRRDALDNLESLDLIAARATQPADRVRFESWRPHETSMRARAEAAIALSAGRRDLAHAALESGLRAVREACRQLGMPERAESGPEVALLRMLLDALTLKLPGSQRVELEARLQQAVLAENYELAAILRDELRQMGGGA